VGANLIPSAQVPEVKSNKSAHGDAVVQELVEDEAFGKKKEGSRSFNKFYLR
jgi:hypothetical protein